MAKNKKKKHSQKPSNQQKNTTKEVKATIEAEAEKTEVKVSEAKTDKTKAEADNTPTVKKAADKKENAESSPSSEKKEKKSDAVSEKKKGENSSAEKMTEPVSEQKVKKTDTLKKKLAKYEPLFNKAKKYAFAFYLAASIFCFVTSIVTFKTEFKNTLKVINDVADETLSDNPRDMFSKMGAIDPNDDNNKNSYDLYAQYIVTTAEPQHISGYKYTKDDDVNAAASALKIHWIAYIISIILFFTGIATLFTGIDRLYVFIRNAVIKYRMDNHLY